MYGKPPSNDTSGKSVNVKALMERLWVRLGELYGSKWERDAGAIGGPAFQVWVREFDGVPAERIATGLRILREELPEWPPTLAEFMRMCSGRSRDGSVQTYGKRNFTEERMKALPPSKTEQRERRSAGRERLAGLLKKFSRGEPVTDETREQSYDNLGLNKRWGSL